MKKLNELGGKRTEEDEAIFDISWTDDIDDVKRKYEKGNEAKVISAKKNKDGTIKVHLKFLVIE